MMCAASPGELLLTQYIFFRELKPIRRRANFMNNLVRSTLLNEEYQLIKHKSGLDIYVFPKNLSVSYAIIAAKFGSIDNCFMNR